MHFLIWVLLWDHLHKGYAVIKFSVKDGLMFNGTETEFMLYFVRFHPS